MPFLKTLTAPNGVMLGYHRIVRAEITGDLSSVYFTVASWPSEAQFLAGGMPVWNFNEMRPLPTASMDAVAGLLLEGGEFEGAARVPDASESIEAAKQRKGSEINAARLRANRSGFEFQGKRVATDGLSMLDIINTSNIVARTGALPQGWVGGWKAIDNSYVAIPDVAAWDAFFSAMYQTGLGNFARSQQLKAQLAAATTLEEVAAITWEAQP